MHGFVSYRFLRKYGRCIETESCLKIEPSSKSFTFVDLSERSSGGIIRDLEVQIGNALVPADFNALDIKLNWNSSLLLGRDFLATVGALCDMNTNRLCLTLINPDVHYDLVRVVRQQVNLVELGNDLVYIAACHLETVIPSSNKHPTEEYNEDYWKERAIEIAMQDERYSSHSFNNTSPPSIDRVYSASVDTHPHPAKRSYASIDTTPCTSIDIKAAAFEKEKENIPIPSSFTNTYIRSFEPQITSNDTIAEKMNDPTNKSEGTSRKSIRSKNPNSADKRLPSIDTPVSTSIDSHSKPKLSLFTKKNMSIDYGFLTPDEFGIFRDPGGHAKAMDGRILQRLSYVRARSLRSDRAVCVLGRYIATELCACSVATSRPSCVRARSLRSDRAVCVIDRYVATSGVRARSLRSDRAVCVLGCYVATELCACSVATNRFVALPFSAINLGVFCGFWENKFYPSEMLSETVFW
ncbi:hypothetical protein F2Q69_00021381 [Brassica cretica]|uniref:Uncharacterized protein n=1 Tax=Brassica cretica TaxID=69181 RepID=A0A8S9Q661_BRACR|nr:hypothetical protein F2Q69_00021381 [Brassica cretica]